VSTGVTTGRPPRALADALAGLATALPSPRPAEAHVAVERAAVPRLAQLVRDAFGAELRALIASDRRADRGAFEVVYLFAHPRDGWFLHATAGVPAAAPAIASLAATSPAAARFEREIQDLFGIAAEGHPDPRPLVKHGFWPADYFPLRKGAVAPALRDDGRPFPFVEVAGEGVYEIPVGPVHAGIIEPGHFRFSVVGETIIDMKARLYWTHKGTEKLFEGRAPADGVALAERISGDTSVGHALAYCQALEAAAGMQVPARAARLRVVLLEMERLYNHVADFGMIANDTGFAVAHAHCFRVREHLLRLNKRLAGHRLLRGALVPGGVAIDAPAGLDLPGEVEAALSDFEETVALSLRSTLVVDRLEATGVLPEETARDHGALGFVARASGIDADVRRDHPFAAYGELAFRVPVHSAGDVKARALVRVEETRESARLIRQALDGLPAGPLAAPLPPLPALAPAFALVEGWRGAILHWVTVDAAGRLERVKVVDPSFLNWPLLSYALADTIVPDFPLCNKSFNQSYSGHDL